MTETAAPSAHVPRRLAGIAIDWTLCLVISSAFFTDPDYPVGATTSLERVLFAGETFATLGVWLVQHLVLVATLGTTIGHRMTGMRVVRAAGPGPVGLLSGLIRTVLLALVIPAVVWDGEGRGLHDKVAGTRIVRAG